MADLVPFGKYRGKPIEDLAADTSYVEWLSGQDWFRNRYGSIYNIVVQGAAQELAETPVHNAMQIKFLDADYRLKFILEVERLDGRQASDVLKFSSESIRQSIVAAREKYISEQVSRWAECKEP